MPDDPKAVAAAIERLSEAQRRAIIEAQFHGSGQTSFATVAFTDPWTAPVAEFFTLHTDRLTPLGLAVRLALQESRHAQ